MVYCEICGKEFQDLSGLTSHFTKAHKITVKEYYDKYIEPGVLHICPICGKEAKFNRINRGYRITCGSADCIEKSRAITNIKKYGSANPFGSTKIINKIQNNIDTQVKEFEQKNNCTEVLQLIHIYGAGWTYTDIGKPYMHYKHRVFVKNECIGQIKQYRQNHKGSSNVELDLIDFCRTIYSGEIKTHSKRIISPFELDIYIPALKLAIEFNGTYWHSIEAGGTKEYHLNKSLLCREKGVRLIHIYEFENLDEQKQLLKDLLNGIDNYPKNDFNKNNLIDNILEPEIIYNQRFTIYGAGKLYK